MRELGEEVSKEVLLELAREHAAMHTYHQRLRQDALDALHTALPSKDIGALLSVCADLKDVQDLEIRALCAQCVERVAELRAEGERVSALKGKLLQLCDGGAVEEVEAALRETEAFAEQMRAERTALEQHYKTLLEAAAAALRDMLTSDAVHDIDECLAEYRGWRDEGVVAAHRELQKHRDTLQRAADEKLSSMRTRLHSLVGEPRLSECQRALTESVDMGSDLHFEREALQAHVVALQATAKAAITDMLTSTSLADIDETIADYGELASAPAAAQAGAEANELSRLFSQLKGRQTQLVDGLQEKLASLATSHDIAALGTALEQAAPYGDMLAAELVVVRKRRSELVDVVRQRLNSLLQSNDPAMMEEALRQAESVPELAAEVGALAARQAATLADGKVVLSRFAAGAAAGGQLRWSVEELTAIKSKYEGHSTYLPEEWGRLEQTYQRVLASERGGAVGAGSLALGGSALEAARERRAAQASAGPSASFGHTLQNSVAAAAELEQANAGLEEMLQQVRRHTYQILLLSAVGLLNRLRVGWVCRRRRVGGRRRRGCGRRPPSASDSSRSSPSCRSALLAPTSLLPPRSSEVSGCVIQAALSGDGTLAGASAGGGGAMGAMPEETEECVICECVASLQASLCA